MMVLSYHPIFTGDKNLICAGREPSREDVKAIRAAEAVILSQGCYESLYKIARNNCAYIFPNFDAKFGFPGKTGQIRLFRETGVAHPETRIYPSVDTLVNSRNEQIRMLPFNFPFVFKFDWGGDGETVHLVQSEEELMDLVHQARRFESSGQSGFLLQEQIPSAARSLRVVVIGQTYISYWRVQKDGKTFSTNLAKGAVLDTDSDPELQHAAIVASKDFCKKTGINLAGIDFLFLSEAKRPPPLFLEINYYFGRRGLGGSENYYVLLVKEINKWLNELRLYKESTGSWERRNR